MLKSRWHRCAPQIHWRALAVGSRGVARQPIFLVQTGQNRRRDHLPVFRKAMTGGYELIRFGQRMWNARSQAGVWTTSVIVGHPFAKDQSGGCGSPKPNRAHSTRLSDMSRSGYAEPMVAWIIRVVRLLIVLASRHRSLALENLALRQQLALYRRTRPKPTMRWSDRLFWIGLRAAWRDWKSALVVVRPATVVAWHRRGFAWYWTRRSRPRGGRPQAGAEIRRLVREMAVANPVPRQNQISRGLLAFA